MSLFEIRGLSACHGLLRAVRNVSLHLDEGEVTALVGANGAGKTTLFRAIAGSHPATGAVLLDGEDLSPLPAHARVARGLALVPEGRRLFSGMSVRENLMLGGEFGRKGPFGLDAAFAAFPHLEPLASAKAGTLSGGQRQSVAIARALMTNPRVIIMDEVSLGLSPAAIAQLYESLTDLRRRTGLTMMLVEQDLSRALGFAERFLCLLEGEVVLEGRSAEVAREAITDAYFGLNRHGREEETHA